MAKICLWNNQHVVGNYRNDIFCGACRQRYMQAFADVEQMNIDFREKGIPKEIGSNERYLDWFLYEALNRLASPSTGVVYCDVEELIPLIGRGTTTVADCLKRLQSQGKIKMNRDGRRRLQSITVHESEEDTDIAA